MAQSVRREKFYGLNLSSSVQCGTIPDFHEASYIKNVLLNENKGFGMRPGRVTAGTLNEAIHSSVWFQDYEDGKHLLLGAADMIYDAGNIGAAPTVSLSGLTDNKPFSATAYQDFLFFVNGTDDNRKFDGTNWSPFNIPAPATGPIVGVDVTPGTLDGDFQYAYCYVYKNAPLFYEEESKFSPYTELLGATVSQFDIKVTADPTGQATYIRIYRRDSNMGSDPDYMNVPFGGLFDLPNVTATYVDNNDVDALGDIPENYLLGEPLAITYAAGTHDIIYTPIALDGITLWKSRLWGWKGKYLYNTVAGRPGKWWNDECEYQPFLIDVQNNENIIGACGSQNTLAILTETKLFLINGDDEAGFTVICRDSSVGCIAPRSIAECGGGLVWLAKDGVKLWTGAWTIDDTILSISEDSVDRDFDHTGRGILDNDTESLKNACGGFVYDEKLYWLSVPTESGVYNSQTFTYNFKLKQTQENLSRWSLYDFGFRSIAITNDKRVVTASGVDGSYVKELTGVTDDGAQIMCFYETRAFNFETEDAYKRLYEITASGSGWGYRIKFTTKIFVPNHGLYVNTKILKGIGDYWGPNAPTATTDVWGTDPPDEATDFWQGNTEHHLMQLYPQIMVGLRVSFRIDLSYDEPHDEYAFWPDDAKEGYLPVFSNVDSTTRETIKIDSSEGVAVHPVHTQGGRYIKTIQDTVDVRTFVLHYDDVTEATDALVSVIDHNVASTAVNYIRKINAATTGWPAGYTTGVVNDIAYDSFLKRLALTADGVGVYAPALIIVDVDPSSATYLQVLFTWSAATNQVGAAGSQIKYVVCHESEWYTWTKCATKFPGTPQGLFYQLGWFNAVGTYRVVFQDGYSPRFDTQNSKSEVFSSNICFPTRSRWDVISIGTPDDGVDGYHGDPICPFANVTSLSAQSGGYGGQLLITTAPFNAGGFGEEATIWHIDITDMLAQYAAPVAARSGTITVPATNPSPGVWTVPGAVEVVTLDFHTGAYKALGGIRVEVQQAHTGAETGIDCLDSLFIETNYGTGHSSAYDDYASAISTQRQCNGSMFCYDDGTVRIGIAHGAATRATAFSLVYNYQVYHQVPGVVECLGIHTTGAEIVQVADADRPVTTPFAFGGYYGTWNIARCMYTTPLWTQIPRGALWDVTSEVYLFPVEDQVKAGIGLWTHDLTTLTRIVAASSDLDYDFVGGLIYAADGFYAVVSNDVTADNLSVQLYDLANSAFYDAYSYTAALDYTGDNSYGVIFDLSHCIIGFATGRTTSADEGEIWFWMLPFVEYGDLWFWMYNQHLSSLDEGKIIQNYFLGFEVVYGSEKRQHI